jgi:hypothetical protein
VGFRYVVHTNRIPSRAKGSDESILEWHVRVLVQRKPYNGGDMYVECQVESLE